MFFQVGFVADKTWTELRVHELLHADDICNVIVLAHGISNVDGKRVIR